MGLRGGRIAGLDTTVLIAKPMALAIARLVQCVVSPGASPSVRSINRATTWGSISVRRSQHGRASCSPPIPISAAPAITIEEMTPC